jgi:hypothetical protein
MRDDDDDDDDDGDGDGDNAATGLIQLSLPNFKSASSRAVMNTWLEALRHAWSRMTGRLWHVKGSRSHVTRQTTHVTRQTAIMSNHT